MTEDEFDFYVKLHNADAQAQLDAEWDSRRR